MLNDKAQCCGRKPVSYKGGSWNSPARQRFCSRCDKAYDYDTGAPIANWAYLVVDGEHAKREGRIDGRTPYDGRPYYCIQCGIGFAEFLACEDGICELESESEALNRRNDKIPSQEGRADG